MATNRIFGGKALGVDAPPEGFEEDIEQTHDVLGGTCAALSPIDFSSKIMNGEKSAALFSGKMPGSDGTSFQDRIPELTASSSLNFGNDARNFDSKIGGFNKSNFDNMFKKQNNFKFNKKMVNIMDGNNTQAIKKVEGMLGSKPSAKRKNVIDNNMATNMLGMGQNNGSKQIQAKMAMMFGSGSSKKQSNVQDKLNMMFTTNGQTPNMPDISKILGAGKQQRGKQPMFDTGFGQSKLKNMPGLPSGVGSSDAQEKLNKILYAGKYNKKSKQTHIGNIGNVTGNIYKNVLGNAGNTENVGWNRLRQQGMVKSNWGDADRDGLPNIMDCNPLNYFKQGPEHEDASEKINETLPIFEDDDDTLETYGEAGPEGVEFETYEGEVPITQEEDREEVMVTPATIGAVGIGMVTEPDEMAEMKAMPLFKPEAPQPETVFTPPTIGALDTPEIQKARAKAEADLITARAGIKIKGLETRAEERSERAAERKAEQETFGQILKKTVVALPKTMLKTKLERSKELSQAEHEGKLLATKRGQIQQAPRQQAPSGAAKKVAAFDRLDTMFRKGLRESTKGASKASQAMGGAAAQSQRAKGKTQDVWMTELTGFGAAPKPAGPKVTEALTGIGGTASMPAVGPAQTELLTGVGQQTAQQSMYGMAQMIGGGFGGMPGQRSGFEAGVAGLGLTREQPPAPGFPGISPPSMAQPMMAPPTPSMAPPTPSMAPPTPSMAPPTPGVEQMEPGVRIVQQPGDARPGDIMVLEGVRYRRNPESFPKPWKNLKTGLHISYPRGAYDKAPEHQERFYEAKYVPTQQEGYQQQY